MDRDIFRMLTSGAKFDKKRKDNDTFKNKKDDVISVNAARYSAKESDQVEAGFSGRATTTDEALFGGSRVTDGDPDLKEVKQRLQRTRDPTERLAIFRKAYRIKVKGDDVPAPLERFEDLEAKHGVPPTVLSNLASLGFHDPTPIQRQATTCLLAGRELLAVAPTGSGKTLAFLVPMLSGIARAKTHSKERMHVRGVVLSPTRELGGQTATVARLLAKGTGVSPALASKALETSGRKAGTVDVLVGTPARLAAMSREGEDLSRCMYLVLDEADKLFEMGFLESIDALLAECGKNLGGEGRDKGNGEREGEGKRKKQKRDSEREAEKHVKQQVPPHAPTRITRALFSATLPEKVEEMASSVLVSPIRVTVGRRNGASENVAQRLLFVGREEGKLLALRQVLTSGVRPPVLVFVHTQERARALHRELLLEGFKVDAIHAGQPQASRNAAVANFRTGKTWVLVATDLIGRGMDFQGVNTVVNYDFPMGTRDYVHRVGRTGRAGREGEAVTFFTEDDAERLRAIAGVMREAGCEVPAWMLTLKKTRKGHYNGKAGKRKDEGPGDGKGKKPRGRGGEDIGMYGATIRALPPGAKRRRKGEGEGEGEEQGEGRGGGDGFGKGERMAGSQAGEGQGERKGEEGGDGKKKKSRRAPKRVREEYRATMAAKN